MSEYQKKLMSVKTPEGEENLWIHSYADLMTLLLGFFIILYSFSKFDEGKFDHISKEFLEAFKGKDQAKQTTLSTEFGQNQKALHTMQNMMAVLNLSSEEALYEKAAKAAQDKDLRAQIASAFESENTTDPGIVAEAYFKEIIIPEAALFAPGGHELTAASKKLLNRLANKLKGLSQKTQIEVIGHSDSLPLRQGHPLSDNFTLSAARAGSVAKHLIDIGVAKSSLKISGMGDLAPIFPEFDSNGYPISENRAKNRRVHIVVKTKGSD